MLLRIDDETYEWFKEHFKNLDDLREVDDDTGDARFLIADEDAEVSERLQVLIENQEAAMKERGRFFHTADTCPACGSPNIEAKHMSGESFSSWQGVWCNDCGKAWTEVYEYAYSEWRN